MSLLLWGLVVVVLGLFADCGLDTRLIYLSGLFIIAAGLVLLLCWFGCVL